MCLLGVKFNVKFLIFHSKQKLEGGRGFQRENLAFDTLTSRTSCGLLLKKPEYGILFLVNVVLKLLNTI